MKGLGSRVAVVGVGALLLTVLALPAASQEAHPWGAFLGCWMSAQQGDDETVLCFNEVDENVEVSTIVDGEVTGTEILVADNQQRRVETDGCSGYRAVGFSTDGHRAFTRSELTCEGETRSNSGVMALLPSNRLIHVREVEIAGDPFSWIEEYRPMNRQWYAERGFEDPTAPNRQELIAIRGRAAQAITTSDVEEAASRVGAGAVELWVAVQPSDFDLDGDEILRLADSGLSESVIDVMVAAAFPERFVLSLDGGAARVAENPPQPTGAPYPVSYAFGYRSYLFDPFFIPYYGYSWYGYPYYPGYGYRSGYVYRPGGPIVVQPQRPGGRMINGQGYSRRTSSPRTAVPASSPPNRGAPVSAPTASQGSSSSGATVSSDGGSTPARTSSGTSTGRTARPR